MKLVYGSGNNYDIILEKENLTYSECCKKISEIFPNTIYFRSWNDEDGNIIIDYGSWSKFFKIIGMSAEEAWNEDRK